MIVFRGRMVLLDIEGTVSPLAFVHEVMFPYARRHAAVFLGRGWESPMVQEALAQMARDAGAASLAAWCPPGLAGPAFVTTQVHQMMDADIKATGLKQLQGLIWEEGFRAGELRSTLFEDVPAALDRWRQAGLDLCIYSSGSVHAQKLFFSHTAAGDLGGFFSGWYDTTTGPKRAAASYAAIAADRGLPAHDILFVSDVVDELDAARAAGMVTAHALRPGNHPASDPHHDHPGITSFTQITCT